jgi:hypothetical protein
MLTAFFSQLRNRSHTASDDFIAVGDCFGLKVLAGIERLCHNIVFLTMEHFSNVVFAFSAGFIH